MRILALADVHGRYEVAERIVREEKGADLLILAGDIGNLPASCREVGRTGEFIKAIAEEFEGTVIVILGNHDCPDLLKEPAGEANVISHGRVSLRSVDVIAVSGSSSAHWLYNLVPVTEERISELLSELSSEADSRRAVVVTHEPPSPSGLSATSSGEHAGSEALMAFIRRWQPLLSVCGHVHEGRGVEGIGRTVAVNPGPAYFGYYAVVELADRRVARVSLRRVKEARRS